MRQDSLGYQVTGVAPSHPDEMPQWQAASVSPHGPGWAASTQPPTATNPDAGVAPAMHGRLVSLASFHPTDTLQTAEDVLSESTRLFHEATAHLADSNACSDLTQEVLQLGHHDLAAEYCADAVRLFDLHMRCKLQAEHLYHQAMHLGFGKGH